MTYEGVSLCCLCPTEQTWWQDRIKAEELKKAPAAGPKNLVPQKGGPAKPGPRAPGGKVVAPKGGKCVFS